MHQHLGIASRIDGILEQRYPAIVRGQYSAEQRQLAQDQSDREHRAEQTQSDLHEISLAAIEANLDLEFDLLCGNRGDDRGEYAQPDAGRVAVTFGMPMWIDSRHARLMELASKLAILGGIVAAQANKVNTNGNS